MKLIRRLYNIKNEQDKELGRHARKQKTTRSELVRRALDALFDQLQAPSEKR